MKSGLTHIDKRGNAHMVDVGGKPETARVAVATGAIRMSRQAIALMKTGSAKGDVLAVARIAAIQAAKRTSDLIPLCHPLPLTRVRVDFKIHTRAARVTIEVEARTTGRTGVEMEAMTAASVGLLTIYDMCKAVDRAMTIENVQLMEKSGGKSGHFRRPA